MEVKRLPHEPLLEVPAHDIALAAVPLVRQVVDRRRVTVGAVNTDASPALGALEELRLGDREAVDAGGRA